MEAINASNERIRKLPTSSRSVRHENRSALLRRWRLKQAGALEDPRLVNRWFPGQRDLLEMLDVLSLEEVERIADCGAPLFTVPLRCTDFSLEACASYSLTDAFEQECVEESFLALSARLDSVRTCMQQGCLIFSLTYTEAAWLSSFCPQELHLLARDPSMVLTPAASSEYFIAAAARSLSTVERTLLGSVSNRHAALMN